MTPNNHTPIIGVTGLPGAGKSLFCRSLSSRYGHYIDSDSLGHKVLFEPEVKTEIQTEFGLEVFEKGEVNRSKLAQKVFSKQSDSEKLNSICHPRIRKEVERIVAHNLAQGCFYVLEAALLIEAGFSEICSMVVLLEAPYKHRQSWVGEKRGWTESQFKRRNDLQKSTSKEQKVHLSVDNSKQVKNLKEKVLDLELALRYYTHLTGQSDWASTVCAQLKTSNN